MRRTPLFWKNNIMGLKFEALIIVVLLSSVAFAAGKDKNAPQIVSSSDAPLQTTSYYDAKTSRDCDGSIFLPGQVCWEVYSVAWQSFDKQTKGINLFVNVWCGSGADCDSNNGFTAWVIIVTDGVVSKFHDPMDFASVGRYIFQGQAATIADEALVRRISAAHEVYFTVQMDSFRHSIKLSSKTLLSMKTVLDTYESLGQSVHSSSQLETPDKKAVSALEEGDQLFKRKQFLEAFSKYLDANLSSDSHVKGIAELRIGMMYFRGDGVDKDRTKTMTWLGEAALLGNQDAKDALAQLNTSSQIANQFAADPALKAQLGANTSAMQTSPAAAASLLYDNASGWNSKTPEERAELLKDGQASRCVILTTPAGAEIDIDGNRAGVSPLGFSLLRHGDQYRTITIKMAGYVTVEKKFLPDGKDIPIGITLVPEPSVGVKP